jgi:hypothetical protein
MSQSALKRSFPGSSAQCSDTNEQVIKRPCTSPAPLTFEMQIVAKPFDGSVQYFYIGSNFAISTCHPLRTPPKSDVSQDISEYGPGMWLFVDKFRCICYQNDSWEQGTTKVHFPPEGSLSVEVSAVINDTKTVLYLLETDYDEQGTNGRAPHSGGLRPPPTSTNMSWHLSKSVVDRHRTLAPNPFKPPIYRLVGDELVLRFMLSKLVCARLFLPVSHLIRITTQIPQSLLTQYEQYKCEQQQQEQQQQQQQQEQQEQPLCKQEPAPKGASISPTTLASPSPSSASVSSRLPSSRLRSSSRLGLKSEKLAQAKRQYSNGESFDLPPEAQELEAEQAAEPQSEAQAQAQAEAKAEAEAEQQIDGQQLEQLEGTDAAAPEEGAMQSSDLLANTLFGASDLAAVYADDADEAFVSANDNHHSSDFGTEQALAQDDDANIDGGEHEFLDDEQEDRMVDGDDEGYQDDDQDDDDDDDDDIAGGLDGLEDTHNTIPTSDTTADDDDDDDDHVDVVPTTTTTTTTMLAATQEHQDDHDSDCFIVRVSSQTRASVTTNGNDVTIDRKPKLESGSYAPVLIVVDDDDDDDSSISISSSNNINSAITSTLQPYVSSNVINNRPFKPVRPIELKPQLISTESWSLFAKHKPRAQAQLEALVSKANEYDRQYLARRKIMEKNLDALQAEMAAAAAASAPQRNKASYYSLMHERNLVSIKAPLTMSPFATTVIDITSNEAGTSVTSSKPEQSGDVADDEEANVDETFTDERDESIYNQYVPQTLPIHCTHPANIVEATTLAASQLPDLHYKGMSIAIEALLAVCCDCANLSGTTCRLAQLPPCCTELGSHSKLSTIQLETVLYTGQRHEQLLPNGQRGGFFIGDGTGVGKGRQIAGMHVIDTTAILVKH